MIKEICTTEFVVLPTTRAKARKMFRIAGACSYVWNHFRKKNLEYKCGRLIKVHPAYTSRTCRKCGHVDRENRKTQARFLCVACGFASNADTNAAMNIRRLGMAQLHGEERSAIKGTPVTREIDARLHT